MTWNDFLDTLQAQIESANIALDEGRPFDGELLQPWAPPVDLGPLTSKNLKRAQSINDQLHELEMRTVNGQAAAQGELTRLNSLKTRAKSINRFAETPVPQYVDQSV